MRLFGSLRTLLTRLRRVLAYAPGPTLGLIAGLGVAGAVMFSTPDVEAKATYESPYGYDRTWNAALRLVRVDNGWKVTEKDAESGYLLFEYSSPENGHKTTSGSIELVRGREADAPVRVVVQLAQMPRYHEQVVADALAAKMRQDYGDPPVRRKPAPPPADAGADGNPQ